MTYRIYDEQGKLTSDEQTTAGLTTTASVGQRLTWTVRAENDGRFLSPAATLRFKVGFGVVDASGALVQDTVPPGGVGRLQVTRTKSQLTFAGRPCPILLLHWGSCRKSSTSRTRSPPSSRASATAY